MGAADLLNNDVISFYRAGHLPLNKALDLIGYLQVEAHAVPLLQGLGCLEAFYSMVERRNDHDLMHNLGVRGQTYARVSIRHYMSRDVMHFPVTCMSEAHSGVFPWRYWPTKMEWRRLYAGAPAQIRGPLTGLSPERSTLPKTSKTELQKLGSVQWNSKVSLFILHYRTKTPKTTVFCPLMLHSGIYILFISYFTLVYLLMWLKPCFQSGLRMNTAGIHCSTHTPSLSLKHKNTKSCLLWPAPKTRTNCTGTLFSIAFYTRVMVPPCGRRSFFRYIICCIWGNVLFLVILNPCFHSIFILIPSYSIFKYGYDSIVLLFMYFMLLNIAFLT